MMRKLFCSALLALFAVMPATAGVPETMSYQGVLMDGGGTFVTDGDYDLDFALYDVDAGGTPVWTESHAAVPVSLGGFHVILGSTSPLSIDFDKTYWLGITVNSGTELSPRVELTSAAYSLETKALCLPYDDSGDNGSGSLFKLTNTSSTADAVGIFVDMPNATGSFASALLARNQQAANGGIAIRGLIEGGGNQSVGVYGQAPGGVGVSGNSTDLYGVQGSSSNSYGLFAHSVNSTGVYGFSASSGSNVAGVEGTITNGAPGLTAAGVSGSISAVTANGYGVRGSHNGSGAGVYGQCNDGRGVYGISQDGVGVFGQSPNGLAGEFAGDVDISGTLTKTSGSFRIDHPLDPENKFLSHSFVESPDMMNIYNGNVRLNASGEAWVEMPEWFDALNRDFRYQLTALGAPAPGLYVAEEMSDRRFKIAGGPSGVKVSWQVTGIRQDAAANYHRIPVETAKGPEERGRYLNPEAFGLPAELSIHWAGSGSADADVELANVDQVGR